LRSLAVLSVRAFSPVFEVAIGLALAIAGTGFLTQQTWWPSVAVGAGLASILLLAVFFTPWWFAGIAISTALVGRLLRFVTSTRFPTHRSCGVT
jgi:hypothetical protein